MTSTMTRRVVRRSFAAVGAGAVVVLASGFVSPALAAPPQSWDDPSNDSTLHTLLILGGIPLALFLLITLLVYLPSIVHGQRYEPALAWRERPEWFGGPRKGVDAAPDQPADESDRGGASAHW